MLNKVQLIGRLGGNPISKGTKESDDFCYFSLATTEKFRDKVTSDIKEITEWHRITCFRKIAEIAIQYLKKGDLVFIEGKIQTNKYIDSMGIEKTSYNIVASELKMLGSKNKNSENFEGSQTEQNSEPVREYTDEELIAMDGMQVKKISNALWERWMELVTSNKQQNQQENQEIPF